MTRHDRSDQQPYQDKGEEIAMQEPGQLAAHGDAERGNQGKKQGMGEAAVAQRMGIRQPAQHQDIKVRQETHYHQERQPARERHGLAQGRSLERSANTQANQRMSEEGGHVKKYIINDSGLQMKGQPCSFKGYIASLEVLAPFLLNFSPGHYRIDLPKIMR